MFKRNFSSFHVRAWACAVLCIGCFRSTYSANNGVEDNDDMASMAAHEFADLHMCEEPPPPMNGELLCSKHKTRQNKYVCKAECEAGFQFPNGKKKGRHLCDLKTGKWTPTYIFPDCIHICTPLCENNGECSENNHCICTPEYRGDRCQYDLALCDPAKALGVSGDWMCNHTSTNTQCILNCPSGTRYESQPADHYKCTLDGIWTPSFAPKCIPINIIQAPASNGFYSIANAIKSTRPSSGLCATWSASHFRTFDGGIYSFRGGSCPYLLAKDCEQNTFSIHVQNGEFCQSASSCGTTVTIYVGSEEYLMFNSENGPTIRNEGENYLVPTAVDGLLFQIVSDYVTVNSPLGFRLKWNRRNTVLLEITSLLKNKTCGLCGKFDGSVLNDFETSDGTITDSVEVFVNSWAMTQLGETCDTKALITDACSEKRERASEAEGHCRVIFNDKFSSCHALVDPNAYFETCKVDYCACSFSDGSCFCDSLAEYFRECFRLGGNVEGGWRNEELCPLSCPEGMLYKDCGSSCPRTCKGTVYDCEDSHCIDGCHCPEGHVLHNGRCVERKSCPCLHNGIEHQSGERVLQDCNACECNGGKWKCTEETCEARCSSTGDPHFTTFDGFNYEFLGSCPYYLVYHDNFTIVQESGPCSSETSVDPATESMYCTQSIKIEYGGGSLLLQPGIKVIMNDKLKDLPLSESGISVSMVTDLFLKVRLDNGISLLWDGHNRIYIDAPPSMFDQTMGLCGTFNRNQNDDFLTPEKDIEADVNTFAARWQASDSCHKRSRRSSRNPYDMQPQKIADAEMLCSVLNSGSFSACHGEVDLEPFFKSCVNDLCVCREKLEDCLCPILADYSLSCTRKGVILNWIDDVPSCKPECSGGQIYKECGNPCTCSCDAVASEDDCKVQCVQGCTCPDGMTMNKEGFCIAIDQCPCLYNGKEYSAGDITLQDSNICSCMNAKWQCRLGSSEELKALDPDSASQEYKIEYVKCLEENNEEFTDCLETCPRTCQNAHLPQKCKTEDCKPGCRCKDGFLLDADLNKCVDVKQCGCIHANKRYEEGDTMKQACNLCTCKSGQWQCTEKLCPGVCTTWGESHFKSYDGKIFDFQGDCEYILSKGKMKGASFTLSVQNIPCGTSGITCSKSFTLDLGPVKADRGDVDEVSGTEEKLIITRGDPLPKMSLNSRFVVLESGLFVLVYTDVGITLRWDKGTRIYITLDPKWRNRVKGLCGNFNDDQADDFLTPFGGIPEARASVFADSWKVHEFCPESKTIEDTCALHPHRKGWAQQKCGILKADVFAECRAVVAVEAFYERCVFDSCACDMGGDCDCLCTAVATYAQECSMHGVPIKWRSQDFCPIQCEECSTYDSCMPSCPKKTCENEFRYLRFQEACSEDFCVEGCNPKHCPEGQIYNNEKEYKCIPKVDCVVPCLEVNGVIYNEGDRITDLEVADPCQSCHCQRGSINCIGSPCVKTEPIRPCVQSGWTPWMNTPSFVGGDYEELSNPLLKATYENFCGTTNMTGIECRVVGTKVPLEETGQRVTCELPHGLTCRDTEQRREICEDYEIRVFCDCGPLDLVERTTTMMPTTVAPTLPSMCEQTGWTPWMSAHLPDEEGESETLDMLRINHYFCADHEIQDIECRTSLTWRYASSDDKDVLCNKKLGLVCTGPDCKDHEVRIYCKCGPEETTPVIPSCVTGWTEYFNTDHPDHSDTGDEETIERIRESHQFCAGGTIEDIECKTVVNNDLVDYSTLDSFGLKCSKNVGFICNKYVRTDNCPDFMVRFYCVCEEAAETTLRTTTLAPTTTTTPLPLTSVPVECGWTPWLNIDNPETGEHDDGDIEDLASVQFIYKTCGGKDLVDIECRMSRTHHSYTDSLQKNLQCDTLHGFRCHNSDQIGKCYDYEIRLLCMYEWCYPQTTTPVPTTEAPTTTENPCPDGQIYDKCAYNCEQMCSSFVHLQCKDVEGGCIAGCRPATGCTFPNVWRDYYTCVPKDECTCAIEEKDSTNILSPNEIVVHGCEKCQCVHDDLKCYTMPGCGTTQKPAEPKKYIEDIQREDCWTEWINVDSPKSEGGDLEVVNTIRGLYQFCPDPVKIECRTAGSKQKPFDVGQVVTCDLQTGLICWNNDNKPEDCYDYEIRFFCPCQTTPPPTTTTTLPPTLEPGTCLYGWTDWYNSHHPDTRGDYESIQSARVSNVFCANDMISAVQCRRVGTADTGVLQHGVHCDLEVGLVCSQEYLGETESCWDYEIRWFCDCPNMTLLPETEPPTTTQPPALLPCAYWSDWINEHHPGKNGDSTKKGVKGGATVVRNDNEKAMPLKLQREQHFCLEGTVSDIECREAETDIDYAESGDNLVCSLISGFRCRGRDQPGRMCKDYKIRYFCSCNEIPSTPVLRRITTPAVNIEPCTVYYGVIDGPNPLPDSSLKASSSKNAESGPQSARFSAVSNWKSAGAWVSGEISDHEFIEIDLGSIQPVYGIVTKGRNGHQEWVKSYKILYSRNGMSYAYVSEHANEEKIFSGNSDSDTPAEHVFSRPFEARFVRIQPITYHKEIAMRVDLLGCAEGMTTVPVLTTQPPPCTDNMGLVDGAIADFQIKTSSDRSENSDGRFVRLNALQTEFNSGGWVAADLDYKQFVQVDFMDPRVLTGVKIQGRDSVPQWVTAFSVSYSSDALSWNDILDYSGINTKIFTGNYDSDTISTIYFPQPIRTRFIRIIPVSWNNWISMRLEILGCYEPYEELVKDNIHTTTAPIMLGECADPMGFENHQLPNSFITVSSSKSPASDQSRIRLNTPSDDRGTGGWIAAIDDYKPVILIDFFEERNLTGIITQGLEDMDKWVMSYYVHYSLDNITWEKVYDKETGNMVFPGNFDRNTPVLKLFSSMILTRYLKITIVDYHTGPALRMEILGCFIPYAEFTPPPPVLMTTTEFCVQNGPWISLSDPASQDYGDLEPIDKIISASGTCSNPFALQCRSLITLKDYSATGQSVTCDLENGLRCLNREQSSYMCYNYEVRIKCWTCGMDTTTTSYPLELCPEVPESMKENCPTSCPVDYVCDGYNCVSRLDCPCFKEEKRFQPSNIIVTSDCKRCECILGGYSNCKAIECPTCLPGQKSRMDEQCVCHCEGCAEGTILCPTSGECINETQWCDGIVDCPNDEVDCPTTIQVTTTTTVAPTTTELPVICSTDYGADTDTCEITANLFDTFDGLVYQYDICDHVLMRERSSHLYSVTIHKTCAPDSPNSCQRYLIIEQDGVVLKIGPSTEDITVQDNRVSSANLWVVSQRFQDFELKKKGNTIVFKSKKYHFDVFWDSVQDVKIVLSKCLSDQVMGLCGLYNKNPADDRTTHDGQLVTNNEDFGNSWSIGAPERCTPSTCPENTMRRAIEVCKALQEEPFNSCTDSLKMESRVESCVVFMCECLQRSSLDARKLQSSDVFYDIYDSGECKCLAYESFVEACEATKPEPVPEWRIKYDCTPECPPGMEWQDCGPGCELTCDNYHDRETICSGGCTPGCYCPAGLIRHHDRCVKPKMCQDCVCRGHGDPNYITFDGRYYAFQGNCTYVLAQHLSSEDKNINFKILATNVECPEEPHTSCTDGLQVFWNGHTIEKFKNKPVYLDGEGLTANDSPFEKDGISITFVPGKSTIIHIKSINLAIRYFDQMYGFNIELPAFYYYNKTEGLCGVCNFIQSDDIYHRDGFITEDIEDFAYSWLEEPNRRENCHLPRVVAPEPPPGICNFTISPCETFLDPELYSMSCQNDVTYSHKPEASMCRSKFQYAQQCCERGISLVDWLKASGCEYSCPEGMHFECTSACPKTCDNYKNYRSEDCDLMPLYTCHCPAGQVLQLGSCVEERLCEVCDSLGHAVGDVWSLGPCEQCECAADLTTKCTVTECPEPPVCKEKESLEKMNKSNSACCDTYQCVEIAELSCPEANLQDCAKGEANVITHVDGCPVYHCECMPDLCPPLLEPLLEEGELFSVEKEGCCPYYSTKCYSEKCSFPPICKPGFKVSTYEGKCCLKYTCIPKKNVCVYQYKYDVVNGTQIDLSPEEYYEREYEVGSSWKDGLCRKCLCVENDGQHAFSCREEICPSPEEFPDAEKYEREILHVPGACCPKYRRTACKVQGVPYSIESEWPSPDGDNCKSYKCVMERGEAAILEKTTFCDKKCPVYAIYVEPSKDSKKCCGECKPVACEENGVIYEDGSTWMSTTKACYKAECSVSANGTHIVYRGESCPPMPDNCPMENVKTDPKGCCSYCKKSTESCSAVQVPIHETRGYFGFVDNVKGFCSNEDALEDLTKCAGQCTVESQYSNLIGDFESVCNCCLPLRTEHRLIVLDCEDGSKIEKVYKQPLSCRCSNCSGRNDRSLESMNKMEQV